MTTNPLMALFSGPTVASFIAPEMTPQINVCLNEAHAMMQTAEFKAAQIAADADDFWAFEPDSFLSRVRPYVVKDGMLQIPVKGVLLHDFPYALGSWATGYDYIWQAFSRGMGDTGVKGIALVVDSGGGTVAGNFDLVDRMWALKGTKPIQGFAAEAAYSAAYSIISVADTISVTRTGGVGSIGVVTSHCDLSGMAEKDGIKVTYIFAGKHKVDGNAFEALPKDVKARIQSRIDSTYEVFVSTVARNRGMDPQAVRDTEAQCFTAQEALSNGLADSIGALDDALAEFSAALSPPDEGDETMSTQDKTAVELAAHEAAVLAARTEGNAAGLAEGRAAGTAEGVTAERTRIAAILASDEGKARPKAALAAALKTDLSVDAAKAFLAETNAETAPVAAAAADPLTAAMTVTGGGAGVGAAVPEGGERPKDGSDTMALVKAMGLPGFKFPATPNA